MQKEENKTKGEQNFHLDINSERTTETETRPPAWRLTDNPLAEREASGVVRVTEMLRQLNSEARPGQARRGSESDEERTSRRSSAGDSGLGNLSESEVLDQDSSERERPGRAPGAAPQGQFSTPGYSSVPMAGLPLVGAMFGLCLGGPVGVLAGAKLGGVAAVGGSILGYTGAMVIKEQRELRTYIDDHYKREPELYVLSPREETILSRRMSLRTPPDGSSGSSGSTRHLPGQRTGGGSLYRRGPAGYRRPSAGSLPSSPAVRRRGQAQTQPAKQLKRKATPRPQYRRLGDLTEEEQRSVLNLICSQGPLEDRTFAVASSACHEDCDHQVIIARGQAALPAFTEDGTAITRKARNSRVKARTSSLPDVLEEDCLSVKSLTS